MRKQKDNSVEQRDENPRQRVPNRLLREAREQKGLGHKDVAEYVGAPDPHTVGRWERGESRPQPHYRQKLCQLFEKSAEELGLVPNRPEKTASIDEPAIRLEKPTTDYLWEVPPTFTSFVGRAQDIAAVCALLQFPDVRLVTLLGPGGVGKTRLSLQVASAMKTSFTNGVCFVSLAAVSDPIFVLPTIAHTMGIQESRVQSVAEQTKSVLRDRHCLLILDNFEQVVAAAPLIEELLTTCPGLKVLTTSRAVLHLRAEQRYTVESLAVSGTNGSATPESLGQNAAIALFVQRAQALLPTFQLTADNAQTIMEICERLDGLPLAIELAAARIKLLPPRALLNQISQGLHILKSDLRDLSERQQSMSNAIEWSYDLLNEQEQWLFRHLAVFPGGCSLEAVEALLHNERWLDHLAILDVLSSLMDKSLLLQTEQDGETPRFGMLATMREYGLACLQMLGEKETSQQSQARYYLTVVEQARANLNGEDQARWLTHLEKEKENLRAALSYFIRNAETSAALNFCEPFGKFCGLRGYWQEEQYWLQTALSLPWTASEAAIRARVLRRAGHLAYRLRNLFGARQLLEESITLSRSVDDKQNLAGALGSLGWTMYRLQDIASASQLLHEGVAAARASGDPWAISNSLESLGRLMYQQGNLEEAQQLLEESVELAREIGDKENLARTLTTFASIAIAQNDIEQAAALAQESYELARALNTRPLMALVLDSLGDIALFRGEYSQARDFFEERILLARELSDTSTITTRQLRLGDIALAQGDLARAATFAQEGLRFFRRQGDKPNIAAALSILGDIKRTQGELKKATAFYKEASRLARDIGAKPGTDRPLIGLAQIVLAQGQAAQAARLLGFTEAWATIAPREMNPAQRLAHEQAIEQARVQLEADTFAAAWNEGQALTFDEALGLVLSID